MRQRMHDLNCNKGGFQVDFIDEKLKAYDKKMRKLNYERLDNISNLSDTIFSKMEKIQTIDNRKIILNVALSLNDDIAKIKNCSLAIVNFKRDVGIYTEDEYEKEKEWIIKATDEQVFWRYCSEERMIYQEILDNTFIYPWKGTWDYADCMGLFDLDRVELAKAIKKDIQEMYPDIRWSVTSEEGYLLQSDDSIHIKVLKIPRKYLEGPKYDEYQIKPSVLNDLFKYREEINPRCHIYVEYHWIKEHQVIDDD